MNGTDSLVPAHDVKVNGQPLSDQATADLTEVTVYQDVAAPAMFTLRLLNWDMDKRELTWSDDKLFDVGAEVEVGMGYVGATESLVVGEVTGLEPEFSAESVSTLMVRGHDRSHRLLRGKRTQTFVDMKDSEIVKKVAGAAGLSVDVVDTGVKLDYVLQHNQTDMEFLRERARRIGYELSVEAKKLRFRPAPLTTKPTLTVSEAEGLIEFRPRLTSMVQVSDVEVRGWDPKAKKEIVGQAPAGRVKATMGGRSVGPKASNSAFGKSVGGTTTWPVTTVAEAKKVAEGLLEQTALAYVVGEGVIVGNPKLRAGLTIEVEGCGDRFSGVYYVTSATHSYRPRYGYRTSFTVRRTAS